MIKAERHDNIRRLLDERGMVSVKAVADALDVSDMTIRRDLEELAEAGEVKRIHGGARTARPRTSSMVGREFSHAEKRTIHADEKKSVATCAASLIKPGQTVFLGAGTTVERMIPLLPDCCLRIVTNSLSVFNLLANREDFELCLVGGTFRPRTGAFVGPMAEDVLRSIGVDAAFIGANGVLGDDAFTSSIEEGRIQQLAFENADTRYLIMDSSKVGKRDFYSFYKLSDLDAVVCESHMPEEKRQAITEFTRVLHETENKHAEPTSTSLSKS